MTGRFACLLLGTAVYTLAVADTITLHPPQLAPNEVLIGNSAVSAGGCSSSSQTFTAGIPNFANLDTSYQGGPLPGIRIEVLSKTNGAGYMNFSFTPAGQGITYQLSATGDGTWQSNPLGGGGGVCIGASGAWINIDVIAEYKASSRK